MKYGPASQAINVEAKAKLMRFLFPHLFFLQFVVAVCCQFVCTSVMFDEVFDDIENLPSKKDSNRANKFSKRKKRRNFSQKVNK
jgi:hypothetical protein